MQNGNNFVNKYLKKLKIQIIFLYLIIKVDIKLEVYYIKDKDNVFDVVPAIT